MTEDRKTTKKMTKDSQIDKQCLIDDQFIEETVLMSQTLIKARKKRSEELEDKEMTNKMSLNF